MSKQKSTGTNLESLIDLLKSKNGATRLKARKSLVVLGKPAVPSLILTLQKSKGDHVRWEAAKTLGAIGDFRSIPVLVNALEDSNPDVAWLAAEALKKFKKAAWPALLRALIKSKPESILLRQGTRHVLRNQREKGFNDLLATLMKTLEFNTVPISTFAAAHNLLTQLKEKS